MNWNKLNTSFGYSLIELVVVIVLIAILASIAVSGLKHSVETARVEETRSEMDRLAKAIVGDPSLVSGGNRTDFGYVGDVGALPSNLNALVTNPGYATWNGPYVRDAFYSSTSSNPAEYRYDAWGKAYTYTGTNVISSTGSGSSLTRQLAPSVSDLISNTVTLTILDISNVPPGPTYADSVLVTLTYPNGAGGTTTATAHPSSGGSVSFSGVPMGRQMLNVIYTPEGDTLKRQVTVNPGESFYTEMVFHEKYW
jgi:prepilin-type N-terminal cleavage/methylation domain-containing protein